MDAVRNADVHHIIFLSEIRIQGIRETKRKWWPCLSLCHCVRFGHTRHWSDRNYSVREVGVEKLITARDRVQHAIEAGGSYERIIQP